MWSAEKEPVVRDDCGWHPHVRSEVVCLDVRDYGARYKRHEYECCEAG